LGFPELPLVQAVRDYLLFSVGMDLATMVVLAPIVMVTGPQAARQQALLQAQAQGHYGIPMGSMVDPYAPAQPHLPSAKGQIFGRIEAI
jgi:hypothetical protein